MIGAVANMFSCKAPHRRECYPSCAGVFSLEKNMRYIGGKTSLADWVVFNLNKLFPNNRKIELFCGGLSITTKWKPIIACDNQICIINLYTAWQAGWRPNTNYVTEEQYYNIKDSKNVADPMYAFCAYGLSFGGKFWGGYAREKNRNFTLNAISSLHSKLEGLSTQFICSDYTKIVLEPNDIVYADPPYRNTLQAYNQERFNSVAFWGWVEQQTQLGINLVVSEISGPTKYPTIEIATKKLIGSGSLNEKLFVCKAIT